MAVPRLRVPPRRSRPGRRAILRRGRALPPHVHDAAAVVGRDDAARARALARGDELVAALARLRHGVARPRRVPVLAAAAAGLDLAGERDRRGPGVRAVRARRLSGGSRTGRRSRRPRGGAAGTTPGTGTLAVLLASTSDLDDAIPTLVAYQLEWNKLHALLRAAELPPEPEPLDVAERDRRLRGGLDARARVLAGRACGVRRRGPRAQAEPADPDARRVAVGLRAAHPPLVGADAGDPDRPGRCRTGRCTSSPPTRTRW